jgi:hypothetical protein
MCKKILSLVALSCLAAFVFTSFSVRKGKAEEQSSEHARQISLTELKELHDSETAEEIIKSFLEEKSDEARASNVAVVKEYLKERKESKQNLTAIKKVVVPKFLEFLNAAEEHTSQTQDEAILLSELGEKGDTDKTTMMIQRAEVFEMMQWREGEYANEEEKRLAEKFMVDLPPQKRTNFIEISLHKAVHEGQGLNKDWIRPLVEIIFDPKSTSAAREFANFNLGLIEDTKMIDIFKKLLEHKDTIVQLVSIRMLYFLGKKDLSFGKLVEICQRGEIFAPQHFFLRIPKTYDPEAKPYLLKIVTFSNNPTMQIMAAYYLYKLGEKEISIETRNAVEEYFEANKSEMKEREYDLIERYLSRF